MFPSDDDCVFESVPDVGDSSVIGSLGFFFDFLGLIGLL